MPYWVIYYDRDILTHTCFSTASLRDDFIAEQERDRLDFFTVVATGHGTIHEVAFLTREKP